jgi:transposase
VSRARIREFLAVWFGVPLSVGTLDRCIREVGVACEPVVEDLLGDLRQAGVIHADETPWRQHGRLRWLWVVLSSTTAIFHIGSRQADEIRDLAACRTGVFSQALKSTVTGLAEPADLAFSG